MKFRGAAFFICLTACAWIFLMPAAAAHAAFLEKKFVVCQDQGREVLCDAYLVKKNDYVTKLFKQRGEIAYRDFPMFLNIFKRLNPAVKDIDLIYPDQRLLIPLRIIEPDTLEGQDTGTVTIPLITITNIPRQLQQNSMNYVVQQGDCVSALIAKKFGRYSTRPYKEAIKIFKYLNPDIKDLNLIRVGQNINVPVPAIRDELWYADVFDDAGELVVEETPQVRKAQVMDIPLEARIPPPVAADPVPASADLTAPELSKPAASDVAREGVVPEPAETFFPTLDRVKPESMFAMPAPAPAAAPEPEPEAAASAPEPEPKPAPDTPPPAEEKAKPPEKSSPPEPIVALPSIFKKAAAIFSAQLLDTGEYFFPRPGKPDLTLNLAATPVMEFGSGRRILFGRASSLTSEVQAAITGFWDDLHIVTLSYDASLRELLYTICQLLDPDGCDNLFSVQDPPVQVTVRGELIYDNPGGAGKVCVTLINTKQEKMADELCHYLMSRQLVISEWIDRENFFGPAGLESSAPPARGSVSVLDGSEPKGFVRDFAAALGMKYQENVEASFPYAGFQVNALSNLLTMAPGSDFLIDFGDLQGDAVTAIEQTGFRVLQFSPGVRGRAIADALLRLMPLQTEDNPVFAGADRSPAFNAEVQVSGRLIFGAAATGPVKVLITDADIDALILSFLNRQGVRAVTIQDN